MVALLKLVEGGGSSFERDLLVAARSEQVPSESRARVASALGIALPGTTPGAPAALPESNRIHPASRASASAPLRHTGLGTIAKLALLGCIGGLVASNPMPDSSSRRDPSASRAPEAAVAHEAPMPLERPAPASALVESEPRAPSPTPHVDETQPIPKPRLTNRSRAQPTRAGSGRLMAEVMRLDAARSALRDVRAERAISLLDAYDVEFPRGELALEAAVLRVQALQFNQPRAAIDLARDTLSRPGSERYRTELTRVIHAGHPLRQK